MTQGAQKGGQGPTLLLYPSGAVGSLPLPGTDARELRQPVRPEGTQRTAKVGGRLGAPCGNKRGMR